MKPCKSENSDTVTIFLFSGQFKQQWTFGRFLRVQLCAAFLLSGKVSCSILNCSFDTNKKRRSTSPKLQRDRKTRTHVNMQRQNPEKRASPLQISWWVLEVQYTQTIVPIRVTYNYASRLGGLLFTCCKSGALDYSRIKRKTDRSDLTQQKSWKLQRRFFKKNTWFTQNSGVSLGTLRYPETRGSKRELSLMRK